MTRHYRTWKETEVEHFRNHPEEIPLYLDIAFEEADRAGDWGAFMGSLRVVAEAQGGLGDLAKRLDCNRAHLYKALSEGGNPRLETLGSILHELGLRLSVQPIHH
jgi:probable addiction module antidote protein